MKAFNMPAIEVLELEVKDVIATSGGNACDTLLEEDWD